MIRIPAAILCLVSAIAVPTVVSAQSVDKDDVRDMLQQLEQIVQAGAISQYFALLADSADRERARAFAAFEIGNGATRVVIQERDRAALKGALPGNGYELFVDVFTESGNRARAATWRIDVTRARDDPSWRIADQEQITSVEGLYRLLLDPARQFDVQNLTIVAEDLDLNLPSVSAMRVDI